jgi:hypothetical protein
MSHASWGPPAYNLARIRSGARSTGSSTSAKILLSARAKASSIFASFLVLVLKPSECSDSWVPSCTAL